MNHIYDWFAKCLWDLRGGLLGRKCEGQIP